MDKVIKTSIHLKMSPALFVRTKRTSHAAFPTSDRLHLSIEEQLLSRNVERLRGGLLFKAHRLLYRSTLGSRVIKKKKKAEGLTCDEDEADAPDQGQF